MNIWGNGHWGKWAFEKNGHLGEEKSKLPQGGIPNALRPFSQVFANGHLDVWEEGVP